MKITLNGEYDSDFVLDSNKEYISRREADLMFGDKHTNYGQISLTIQSRDLVCLLSYLYGQLDLDPTEQDLDRIEESIDMIEENIDKIKKIFHP